MPLALIPMKLWDNLFARLLCFLQVPEPPNALLKNISEEVYILVNGYFKSAVLQDIMRRRTLCERNSLNIRKAVDYYALGLFGL